MSLRLLSASPISRLLSATAARSYLGLGSDTSYDATIGALQDTIARSFAEILGFPLPRQRYEETVAGNGRQRLILSVRPLDRDDLTVTLDDVELDDAADEFSIDDPRQGVLFRSYGWSSADVLPGNDGLGNIVVTYRAGYVLPEVLSTWAANDTTIANATTKWIRPTSPALSLFLFEVTTAGTLGATEPTWPTTAGSTVTSGTAVLTARDAYELPAPITLAAQIWLKVLFGNLGASPLAVPGNIASERHGPVELTYAAAGQTGGLSDLVPRPVLSLLELFR